MVIPERVALEKIHLLPPAGRGDRGGGGPRRRRALRRAAEALLLLRLPAGGSELYLQLRRDLRFLARDFVVEQRRGEGRRAAGPRRPSEERLCFYTGHVLNRSDSFASLSTCAGLVLAARPDGCPPFPASPRAHGAVGSFPAVPCLRGCRSAPGFVLGEMPHGGKKRLWGWAGASPQHFTSVLPLSASPQHLTWVPFLTASPQPPVPRCVSGVPPVRAFLSAPGSCPRTPMSEGPRLTPTADTHLRGLESATGAGECSLWWCCPPFGCLVGSACPGPLSSRYRGHCGTAWDSGASARHRSFSLPLPLGVCA